MLLCSFSFFFFSSTYTHTSSVRSLMKTICSLNPFNPFALLLQMWQQKVKTAICGFCAKRNEEVLEKPVWFHLFNLKFELDILNVFKTHVGQNFGNIWVRDKTCSYDPRLSIFWIISSILYFFCILLL